MFTGLITDVGELVSIAAAGNGVSMVVRTAYDLSQVDEGASIACDGVCLTAESFGADTFTITAGQETLDKTTLGSWTPGRRMHLEQATRVGDHLGGHLVQGHVDGIGTIRSVEVREESWIFWVEPSVDLARYIVTKGSITVDGVSLTVNELDSTDAFRLNIIPHTVKNTHVDTWRAGAQVNLEVDVLARYVERLLTWKPAAGHAASGLTLERLAELGYGRD